MKVDIWSDVNCPFCYIGKKKFETALAQFEHADEVEVEWHSFELDPHAVTNTELNAAQFLADKKGQTLEWAIQMQDHVKNAAAEVGLQFDFDKAIMANSFKAHRLIQLAKSKGLADEVEEALFIANFTDGKNIDDPAVLLELGKESGLQADEVQEMLEGYVYGDDVRADEEAASKIGISGVPFFIINQKLAVSGAQAPETFLGALNQAYQTAAETGS
ncbi:DsbA family oxidoreductase [Pedobacter antarcticus]|uniref:DSBA oxidoreductase n=2 Tax=Pedobacter antarcticus TaxID=34086 RepID=A0A081PLU2_9SPHI|nr:DsbA family oxidoreductase [Pedobacter antarcticus]KEQ31665.1 DSBA oxidoreductase [Pedobacter antarcticus 4BY]SDL51068.1 Predicted dithiol-disulfide isomerase, DsbA family [Pedobacter antarcticus]SFE34251.1 Predicted dithiol-disulfide isomerase, DsbA family [Pedobacter antarcticus]